MDIAFRNKTLKKVFNSEKELKKKFGAEKAHLIMRRMAVLRASPVFPEEKSRRKLLKQLAIFNARLIMNLSPK
ncbi:MAG: hypothetical protein JRF39_08830, partial [Deltaproteobacteria bacterium]|nr:hypothetical protein [Deltaproteobacteria bacterium]